MFVSIAKRMLLLCLCGLLAVSSFVSCAKEELPPADSETETETEAPTEPVKQEVFTYLGTEITGVLDTTAVSYEIPDTATAIGDGAFKNCVNLTSIVIPDTVTEIGENAFEGCTALASVTVPSTLTEIPEGLFKIAPLSQRCPSPNRWLFWIPPLLMAVTR